MKWKPDFERTYDDLITEPVMRSYFGAEGYYNAGYWDDGVTSPAEASRNLTDRLVARVPLGAARIAEIGCGLGATTRRISQLRPDAEIFAVNFSLRQLGICRTNCPSAQLVQMDAASLSFASASIDAVVSIEAAFHFCTRRDFIVESARTLKPGGSLIVADILFAAAGWPGSFTVPEENFLPNPAAYREILLAAGFEDIRIEDATDKCWGGFCNGQEVWSQNQPSFDHAQRRYWRDHVARLRAGVTHYLMISARTSVVGTGGPP